VDSVRRGVFVRKPPRRPIRAALLGRTIGPEWNRFDPGKMGSYFQLPYDVKTSAMLLEGAFSQELSDFQQFLRGCEKERRGLYVTF
jgi:hypothetical protein